MLGLDHEDDHGALMDDTLKPGEVRAVRLTSGPPPPATTTTETTATTESPPATTTEPETATEEAATVATTSTTPSEPTPWTVTVAEGADHAITVSVTDGNLVVLVDGVAPFARSTPSRASPSRVPTEPIRCSSTAA